MPLIVQATYENGVLKPEQPLPLDEHEKVRLTVDRAQDAPGKGSEPRGQAVVPWTGSVDDLDLLIEDAENDPLEGP
jgi:predicted DNA-binding antitoxin AbrB/MazE fold protein